MNEVAEKPISKTTDPVTNDSIDRILELFNKQKKHLQHLKNTTSRERKQKLKKLKKAIFAHRERIQQALYNDFKKAKPETDLTEIYPAISEIKHTISRMDEWMLPEEVDTPITYLGSSSYIQYEPKGNCLIITPWNYPFYLAISPVIYAIAAGNAAIIKPSEFTPHSSEAIKQMLAEVFDEQEVAVVYGDHTVSQQLLQLKFDHIHFTGSPQVGKIIMESAAKHLTSVTLELGGKSPTIVDKTASIKEAAKKITWGKFINEGQTCIAPDYVLVHKDKTSELVRELTLQIKKNYGSTEDERQDSPDYARTINQKHFSRIKSLIEEAVEKGATVEVGGQYNDNDLYISPTILTNVSKDTQIMQEEIFGPVLPIIEYQELSEAIEYINQKEKPLALYIFSNKNKDAQKIIQETSSGGTCINDVVLHISQPNLPFGGVNHSGIGKSHGKWGFVDFSNERAVLKQHVRWSAAQLMHPPYTGFVKKLINLTLKWF